MDGNLVIEQFPSGYSNLTYLLKIGDRELVLRRPPFGANIKTAHDMSREYRILSSLTKVYPKVPRPLLYTADEQIIGTPFYVIERVQGIILRARMPHEMSPASQTMAGIAKSLAATLAELHQIDNQGIGLGDLVRPEGYAERQINGWTKRYLNAKTDDIPIIEQVAQWLSDNLPPASAPALIHNDLKYDNVILAPDDWTKIIAILDWEMSTIGDPLMDLGTSLGYWVNADDPPWMQQLALSPTTLPGNPGREGFAKWHAAASSRDISDLVF